MDTPLFDRIAQDGTAGQYLRLADGHGLTLIARPGSPDGVDEVYLWAGFQRHHDPPAVGIATHLQVHRTNRPTDQYRSE